MLIQDQFDIIQNLQTFPILQTSFLVGTFCRFLQQDGSKKALTLADNSLKIDIKTKEKYIRLFDYQMILFFSCTLLKERSVSPSKATPQPSPSSAWRATPPTPPCSASPFEMFKVANCTLLRSEIPHLVTRLSKKRPWMSSFHQRLKRTFLWRCR